MTCHAFWDAFISNFSVHSLSLRAGTPFLLTVIVIFSAFIRMPFIRPVLGIHLYLIHTFISLKNDLPLSFSQAKYLFLHALYPCYGRSSWASGAASDEEAANSAAALPQDRTRNPWTWDCEGDPSRGLRHNVIRGGGDDTPAYRRSAVSVTSPYFYLGSNAHATTAK